MKDKLSIEALFVTIIFATLTSTVFIILFFSLGLNKNLLGGGLTVIATFLVQRFECRVIYALHKAHIAYRQEKSK